MVSLLVWKAWVSQSGDVNRFGRAVADRSAYRVLELRWHDVARHHRNSIVADLEDVRCVRLAKPAALALLAVNPHSHA
jgi:hypothetical protein